MLQQLRRSRNIKTILTETRKVVQEEEEVAVEEEAAIKEAEVVLDPKPNMKTAKIVPMVNANQFTKRRLMQLKKLKKLRDLKRKSKVVIRDNKIEPMKLMKTPTITDITTHQDLNTKEFKSLLILKFPQFHPKMRERNNQIKTILIRK